MTNEERRAIITAIKEKLSPLDFDLQIKSLDYNFHSRAFIDTQNEKYKTRAEELLIEIEKLKTEVIPLHQELRTYQVKYLITYEGLEFKNGFLNPEINEEIFYLSTDLDLDTQNNTDLNSPDFAMIYQEIALYIINCKYSEGTIKRIVRLKE